MRIVFVYLLFLVACAQNAPSQKVEAIKVGNYLGATNFCHKMPFLRLFLPYFSHVA